MSLRRFTAALVLERQLVATASQLATMRSFANVLAPIRDLNPRLR
jgi:hypothetical protein